MYKHLVRSELNMSFLNFCHCFTALAWRLDGTTVKFTCYSEFTCKNPQNNYLLFGCLDRKSFDGVFVKHKNGKSKQKSSIVKQYRGWIYSYRTVQIKFVQYLTKHVQLLTKLLQISKKNDYCIYQSILTCHKQEWVAAAMQHPNPFWVRTTMTHPLWCCKRPQCFDRMCMRLQRGVNNIW